MQNQDPAQAEREAVSERFGAGIEARRSPRQRELANTIYQRLAAGAEVEDIAHLISDVSRTAGQDNRIPGRARR
ncbi:hypothetical protein ABIA32_001752 [Streptacidiphilus sp. MAP12-20]|uniref:hypothetical protein n=1 Tax=Streptacidiphilus sp. MAP12-20 TaxID=3156299 RepID=UPI003515A06D